MFTPRQDYVNLMLIRRVTLGCPIGIVIVFADPRSLSLQGEISSRSFAYEVVGCDMCE